MVTRIGEKLSVLVEDRVGTEAGLEGVGLGLGDLVKLGVEVAAAVERDVDGLFEGQSVRRAIVLGTGGKRERADKRRRRRCERLGLRTGDRRLKSGGEGADAGLTTEVGTPLGAVVPARLLR